MQHLINLTTGQVLLFKKTMKSEDKLAYTLYDNGIDYTRGVFLEDTFMLLDKTIVPTELLAYTEYLDYIGLTTLKNAFPDFIETENPDQWIKETGSTDLPTTVRVLLPNEFIGKQLYTGSLIDQLIQAMSPLSLWATRGDKAIVQYLEELLPEHEAILNGYAVQGVIIEKKPVPVYAVTFIVTDAGQPVEDATINIDGNTLSTANGGEAVIPLPAGSYPYIVTYPGNEEITGTAIVVSEDITLTISK